MPSTPHISVDLVEAISGVDDMLALLESLLMMCRISESATTVAELLIVVDNTGEITNSFEIWL